MNPPVLQFWFMGGQTAFTRPNAVMEVSETRRLRIWFNRLASRAQPHEDHSVGYVEDLTHQIKPRVPVFTRRFSEIRPKISLFLRVIRDNKIRHYRQIEVPVIQESGLPIHQPDAVSVEKDVCGLQIVVTRDHVRIVT